MTKLKERYVQAAPTKVYMSTLDRAISAAESQYIKNRTPENKRILAELKLKKFERSK
jgi:hypothetical protein